MTIESLKQDLDNAYEGDIGALEVKSYWAERKIDGDSENMLYIHYKNGKEIEREVRPKKVYKWQ